MGHYAELKSAIENAVATNGIGAITGEVMQTALLSIVNNLGKYGTCAGTASPTTDPGTIDQNVFYFATQLGSYTYFNISITTPGLYILVYDSTRRFWMNFKLIDMNTSGEAYSRNSSSSTADGRLTLMLSGNESKYVVQTTLSSDVNSVAVDFADNYFGDSFNTTEVIVAIKCTSSTTVRLGNTGCVPVGVLPTSWDVPANGVIALQLLKADSSFIMAIPLFITPSASSGEDSDDSAVQDQEMLFSSWGLCLADPTSKALLSKQNGASVFNSVSTPSAHYHACATDTWGVTVGIDRTCALYKNEGGNMTMEKAYTFSSWSGTTRWAGIIGKSVAIILDSDDNNCAVINTDSGELQYLDFEIPDLPSVSKGDIEIYRCVSTPKGVMFLMKIISSSAYYIGKLAYSNSTLQANYKRVDTEVYDIYYSVELDEVQVATSLNGFCKVSADLEVESLGVPLPAEVAGPKLYFAISPERKYLFSYRNSENKHHIFYLSDGQTVGAESELTVQGIYYHSGDFYIASTSGLYVFGSISEGSLVLSDYIVCGAGSKGGIYVVKSANSGDVLEGGSDKTYSVANTKNYVLACGMGTNSYILRYDKSSELIDRFTYALPSSLRYVEALQDDFAIALGSNNSGYRVFNAAEPSTTLCEGYLGKAVGVAWVTQVENGVLVQLMSSAGALIYAKYNADTNVLEQQAITCPLQGVVYHMTYNDLLKKGYLRTDTFEVAEFSYNDGAISVGQIYDVSCLKNVSSNVSSLRTGLVANGKMIVTSQNSTGSVRTMHIAPVESCETVSSYTNVDVSSAGLGYSSFKGNEVFIGSMTQKGLYKVDFANNNVVIVCDGDFYDVKAEPIVQKTDPKVSASLYTGGNIYFVDSIFSISLQSEGTLPLTKNDIAYNFSGGQDKVASASDVQQLNTRVVNLENNEPDGSGQNSLAADPTTLNLPLFERVFVEGASITEFTNVSGATLTDSGWRLSSNGTMIKLNKYYSLGCRTLRMLCKLNGTLKIKGDTDTNYFLVNPTNKTISLVANSTKTVSASFLNTSDEFLVDVFLWEQTVGLRIYDLNSTQYAEVSVVHNGIEGYPPTGTNDGITYFHDYYTFGLASAGSVTIKKIGVYSKKVDLLIYGDSITECAYYPTADWPKCWTKMIIDRCSAMTSGRGGTAITQINSRIGNEVPFIKPKYVMVTIGTNGGNTTSNLKSLVDTIKGYGCECYLNNIPCNESGTQVSTNSVIESVRASESIKGVKFDVATSINRAGQSLDSNLMYEEDYSGTGMNGNKAYYHHPNPNGSAAMFRQILIDAPEILVKE